MKNKLFRSIPKIDEILNNNEIILMLNTVSRNLILDSIRIVIDEIREEIKLLEESEIELYQLSFSNIIKKVKLLAEEKNKYKLKKVINATGVIIHTNLGRSLISESIKNNLLEVSSNYSTLEFDISSGKRGSRYTHVESLLCELTGAEAAIVVNNNAAAVMLVLNTMAKDKEIIVSRGQLVEIGGSFRIPEVMKLSGAKLVEVGATNKTHIHDYEDNITDDTALLLKVHTSNFKMLGFTEEVSSKDLVSLAHKNELPVYDDLGSGMLIDLSKYGLSKEPTVQECIESGTDIVSFSGDKMLGGPQAGIIIGKKIYIDKMKKNQLTRALRVDKMTFAVLEGTLRLYRDEKKAIENIPTLNMITKKYDKISKETIMFLENLNKFENIEYKFKDDYSEVGGGSMPLEKLLSRVIVFTHKNKSPNEVIDFLRYFKIPIIGRINDNEVILDFRTIVIKDHNIIIEALNELDKL